MDSRTSPALVFDLDGTLVDTAPDLLGALNAILLREGRPPVNHADLRHLVGFGARTMLAEAFKMTGEPADEDRLSGLMDAYIAHYKKHIAVASRPFPGVRKTLERLKAEGTRMAVLTNKPQELTDALLPRLGLEGMFAAVYGAGRKAYTKPDPRIFHEVVDDCGGTPGVMIGDSITDLNTARAAAAPCILFSYGFTPVPAAELGADLVLDDFAELPGALARLKLL